MTTTITTKLTMHLSEHFVEYVTGKPDGKPGTDTQNGSWVYLFQTQPPDIAKDTKAPYWTPLVLNGELQSSVTHTEAGYEIDIPLTTTATPTANSAAIFLVIQSEDPATHTDLPTTIGSNETLLQPNVQQWNYGYAAFEYALLGQAGDQGDITYIPGFGPHLAVKVNDTSRGLDLDSIDFLKKLASPPGASFTYPSVPSSAPPDTKPYSVLDGKPSIAVSPSNGNFGGTYFKPEDWKDYLDTVAEAGKATFSGTTAGSPDASAIWHNGAYYSYSISQVTTTSDPTTKYLLFSPNSNSQTQGYMLIKQSDVADNLYAPGQGSALAKLYVDAKYSGPGVFNDTAGTGSTPFIVPGSSQPPGSTPTDNSFNVSANTQWGNALTQFFTGFTAGYWDTLATQANPDNVAGEKVDLDFSINWDPAYAFDKNRASTDPAPEYQHNDPYSFQYYTYANAYASAFSDGLAQKLNPGPQISLATGPGVNANVSQIDLYAWGPDEEDGLYIPPVGANYLSKPTDGDYLIPTQVAPPTTSSIILQIKGVNLGSTLVADATMKLGIYKGNSAFEYLPLPTAGNVYQNFNIAGSGGAFTATAVGTNTAGFIQINNLPTSTSPNNGIYWYQLVVADSVGAHQKVFDFYTTTGSNGLLQPYNATTSTGPALATTDGNALINIVTAGGGAGSQINFSLQPDSSLPAVLLTNGYNKHVPSTVFAAPVAGTLVSGIFTPIAGQNGTGVTEAQGYTRIANPNHDEKDPHSPPQYYDNPLPSITLKKSAALAFGWAGTNNVTYDATSLFAPTDPVFEDKAPYTNTVKGQISQYTNKIIAGNTALVTITTGSTHHQVAGVADLDGQWTTGLSAPLSNGTYSVTMTEGMSNGVALAGAPSSAALTVIVAVADMSFASTSGSHVQLDPGSTEADGNWLDLDVLVSSLRNGTILAYATDDDGNLVGRDGQTGSGVTLKDAVVASIGQVTSDSGAVLFTGDQAVYLRSGHHLHFAIESDNGLIQQLPNTVVSGSDMLGIQVTGNNGQIQLTATIDNTLSEDAILAATQRLTSQALTYLTQGSDVAVSVAGSAYNNNTLHFVRIDVDPATGGWSVGGVDYGNTDAFRSAVMANWDQGFAASGGRGTFSSNHDWTVSSGTGYYAPVLSTESGNTFVIGDANVDGMSHIRIYGQNTFGFEDLAASQNSDFDYNDLVMQISMA
jgi:hypothetical protein